MIASYVWPSAYIAKDGSLIFKYGLPIVDQFSIGMKLSRMGGPLNNGK
jgi:hypothetical protein